MPTNVFLLALLLQHLPCHCYKDTYHVIAYLPFLNIAPTNTSYKLPTIVPTNMLALAPTNTPAFAAATCGANVPARALAANHHIPASPCLLTVPPAHGP